MQTVSDTYRAIFAGAHSKEVKVVIAGVEYGQGEFLSVRTYGALFDTPTVGSCPARQIDMSLYPKGAIPRQAEIRVFLRLVGGGMVSEWLPKGVFFFSTRRRDKASGILTVHGYDAMLKAEEVWLNSSYDAENWPWTARKAAEDIARRMGVALDERCDFTGAAPVPYPVGEYGDLTMREVLSGIAVSAAGNWVMTDAGALRLLRCGDIPDPTHYLVTEYGRAIVFGGVKILV